MLRDYASGEQERVPVRRHREVGEQTETLGRAGHITESNERVESLMPTGGEPARARSGMLAEGEGVESGTLGSHRDLADGPGVEYIALGAVDLGVVEDEPHCHLCAFPASRLPLLHPRVNGILVCENFPIFKR